VTDGVQAIVKSFADIFPTWRILSCWNHVLTDIETWVRKHGGCSDDIVIYKEHVRELLKCDTDGELQAKLSKEHGRKHFATTSMTIYWIECCALTLDIYMHPASLLTA
jgi:hypothetical protein